MAENQQDWGYNEMPPSESQPTPEQTAAFKLANALKGGDAVAAQAALDSLKQTSSAGMNLPLDAAAAIEVAALDGHPIPRQALKDAAEWITDSKPLLGGKLQPGAYAREWLIPGWMPASRAGLLTGVGGAGKTRLGLQLAYSIATGSQWLRTEGYSGSPSPVVYATYEDELHELEHRLHIIREAAGAVQSAPPIYGYDLSSNGPLWGIRGNDYEGGFTRTGDALRELCERENPPRLLVIDSLASAFGGNENDRVHVRGFMNAWDSWARDAGCAVLAIGHPPKARGNAKDKDGLTPLVDLFSGNTDWINASRFAMAIDFKQAPSENDDQSTSLRDAPCLRPLKGNYAAEPPAIVWLRNEHGIWEDCEHPHHAYANQPATGNGRTQIQLEHI